MSSSAPARPSAWWPETRPPQNAKNDNMLVVLFASGVLRRVSGEAPARPAPGNGGVSEGILGPRRRSWGICTAAVCAYLSDLQAVAEFPPRGTPDGAQRRAVLPILRLAGHAPNLEGSKPLAGGRGAWRRHHRFHTTTGTASRRDASKVRRYWPEGTSLAVRLGCDPSGIRGCRALVFRGCRLPRSTPG